MARSFNGTSDKITVADSGIHAVGATSGSGSNYTLTFWWKKNGGFSQGTTPIAKRVSASAYAIGFFMEGASFNQPWFQIWDGTHNPSARSTVNICDNNWHFIALVRDKTNSKIWIYVDSNAGISVTDTTTATCQNSEVLQIGHDDTSFHQFVACTIAELVLWYDVLSSGEIAALARGAHSNSIRRSKQQLYLPHMGNATEVDLSGHANTITQTGTSRVNHAPVGRYAPAPRYAAEALVGISTAEIESLLNSGGQTSNNAVNIAANQNIRSLTNWVAPA